MKNPGGATGTVTGDVLVNPEKGDRLNFKPARFVHSLDGSPAFIEDWSTLGGAFITLSFHNDKDVSVTGSGVIVAPGVALCATHVLTDHLPHLMTGATTITAFSLFNDKLQIWNIVSLTIVPDTDLTLLTMMLVSDLPEDRSFALASITTRVPSPGERVYIVGFRANAEKFSRRRESLIEGSLIASSGLVTDVHLTQRDSGFLAWPCFGVECQTWGGMSGGPVFDQSGFLIGLLCSSYENDTLSYVSFLWKALLVPGPGSWPKMDNLNGTPLLARKGLGCVIDRPEAFVAEPIGAQTLYTQNYWY